MKKRSMEKDQKLSTLLLYSDNHTSSTVREIEFAWIECVLSVEEFRTG